MGIPLKSRRVNLAADTTNEADEINRNSNISQAFPNLTIIRHRVFATQISPVGYFHLLMQTHQLLPSTLLPSPVWESSKGAQQILHVLFPELLGEACHLEVPAGDTPVSTQGCCSRVPKDTSLSKHRWDTEFLEGGGGCPCPVPGQYLVIWTAMHVSESHKILHGRSSVSS